MTSRQLVGFFHVSPRTVTEATRSLNEKPARDDGIAKYQAFRFQFLDDCIHCLLILG
jgi:hypothetical protein